MSGRYVCRHRLRRSDRCEGRGPHPRRSDQSDPDACPQAACAAECARRQFLRRYCRGHRLVHDQIQPLLHAGSRRRDHRLYHQGLRRVRPPEGLPERQGRARSRAEGPLGQGHLGGGPGRDVLHVVGDRGRRPRRIDAGCCNNSHVFASAHERNERPLRRRRHRHRLPALRRPQPHRA